MIEQKLQEEGAHMRNTIRTDFRFKQQGTNYSR